MRTERSVAEVGFVAHPKGIMQTSEPPSGSNGNAFESSAYVHEVESWAQFEDIYEQRFRRHRGRWYFRGQLDSRWPLQTTLERVLLHLRARVTSAEPYPRFPSGRVARSASERVELVVLRSFQARASKFLQNLPGPHELLEWLALMRHWGLPTRLLDVTTSIHVALYFAANELLHSQPSEDVSVAVWAINHVPLRATGALRAGVQAHTDLSDPVLFNEHFFGEERKAFIAPVHPRSHSERLAAQQGTFLCMANVDVSFQENVTCCMPTAELHQQSVFHKLKVSPGATIEILERLTAMNIHSASLFPDLQGYARFIEQSLRLFAAKSDQFESHLDFESLERLGWLG